MSMAIGRQEYTDYSNHRRCGTAHRSLGDECLSRSCGASLQHGKALALWIPWRASGVAKLSDVGAWSEGQKHCTFRHTCKYSDTSIY